MRLQRNTKEFVKLLTNAREDGGLTKVQCEVMDRLVAQNEAILTGRSAEPVELRTRRVEVMATTTEAVLVRIENPGIKTWLPRSQVKFPDGVVRGDVLDVDIPAWLLSNAYGTPDR
ncbi:hypothetical protein [Pseudodesulfovibrio indicus]|uniref:Uncharacterized protein n=1 Tax=Pseudodesulfovibrio indicus TaxID=1716143 RepID=A0A140D8V4_9BACT|nr:hypothetical protein [Pseudodesulfovibrio indicus]AMK09621.1 hypothetical protein AWY79_00110 [Pseudodesulfovibrio indicus]TDT86431.1 hypothetical protein EDC59_113107 [Pseudodesulfovibrio indicus]